MRTSHQPSHRPPAGPGLPSEPSGPAGRVVKQPEVTTPRVEPAVGGGVFLAAAVVLLTACGPGSNDAPAVGGSSSLPASAAALEPYGSPCLALEAGGLSEVSAATPDTVPYRVAARSTTALFRVTSGGFLADGTLQVANAGSNTILLLNREAQLVGSLGGMGAGPGEFGTLHFSHAAPDGETLAGFDMANNRVTRFDRGGALLGTLTLEPSVRDQYYDAVPLDAGGALVMTRWRSGSVDRVVGEMVTRPIPILQFDAEGRNPAAIVTMSGRTGVVSRAPSNVIYTTQLPFGVEPVWYADPGGCVLWLDGTREAVYALDVESGVRDSLAVRGLETRVSDAAWQAEMDRWEARRTGPDTEWDRMAGAVKPERHQIASRILYDGVGRLWLEAFNEWHQTTRGWWGIDLRSGHVAWLEAPAETYRMLAVAPGRAAVVTRDALDVETVLLLEFRSDPPGGQ